MSSCGYFDPLHFTESNIGDFKKVERDLIVDVISGIYIFGEHPLKGELKPSDPCILIFKDVVSSCRKISLYTSDRKNFTGEILAEEMSDEPLRGRAYKKYSIEGVSSFPPGWLIWDIEAASFSLEMR